MAEQERLPRAWRLLARLLPDWYADRYGAELWQTHTDAHASSQRDTWFWLRVTWDVVLTSLRLRVDAVLDARRIARQERASSSAPTAYEAMHNSLMLGLRLLRTRPVFAAAVVGTLAIAIGATGAVLGVMDRLLVLPLPFPDGERIVVVGNSWPMFVDGANGEPVSAPGGTFTHLAQYEAGRASIGGPEPRVIRVARVTRDFFPLLGVAPANGHISADVAAASSDNVVIGDALARSVFGDRAAALGKSLTLNGGVHTVTAVMPPAFLFHVRGEVIDAWVPYADDVPVFGSIQAEGSGVIARLRSGLSLRDAQAQSDGHFRQLAAARPTLRLEENDRMQLTPLRDYWFGDLRTPLLLLLAAAACLLVTACANTIGLLLARASARRREAAIRVALGAGRAQLIRESLSESLLLGLLAAGAGVMLGHWGVKLMLAVTPVRIPHADEIGLSVRVVTIAVILAIAAVCVSSIVATWWASRGDLSRGLGAAARGGTFMGARVRQTLAIVQIAITVMLLVHGGLLLRSFRALRFENTGFDAHNVLALEIAPPATRFPDAGSRLQYLTGILETVRAVPGVDHVGMINYLPIESGSLIVPVSTPERAGTGEFTWASRAATPDYFQVMRIPLLAGRAFTDADRQNTRPVMILDRSAATMLAGASGRPEDVIGRHIVPGSGKPVAYEVVGIVGDVRQQGLGIDVYPGFYMSAYQRTPAVVNLVVRSRADAETVMKDVRAALRTADAELPVAPLHELESRISDSVSRRRFAAVLAAVLGFSALVMAIAGLTALMSQYVVHRMHEIGVRVAIGARPPDVLRLVMRQAGTLAATGVAVGLGAALVTSPLIAGVLYGVRASDPATLTVVPLLVVTAAAVGCSIPARRALNANPVDVLRNAG